MALDEFAVRKCRTDGDEGEFTDADEVSRVSRADANENRSGMRLAIAQRAGRGRIGHDFLHGPPKTGRKPHAF
jgi:hypothetical protein